MMDYDHFMGEALREAEAALARGDFPVGCVLVHEGRVVARGGRRGTSGAGRNELDHAEMTALRELAARPQPAPAAGLTVFCTMEPCLMCFGALILNGAAEIVYAYEDVMGGGTVCDRSGLPPLYRDRPLAVRAHVRRGASLALFERFFGDPANRYWRGSLLAEYTLKA
jgi:tRNA(adenine34) deaminase